MLLQRVPRQGPCRKEGGRGIHPQLYHPYKPLPPFYVFVPYSQAGAEDDPGATIALDMPMVVAVILERDDGDLH